MTVTNNGGAQDIPQDTKTSMESNEEKGLIPMVDSNNIRDTKETKVKQNQKVVQFRKTTRVRAMMNRERKNLTKSVWL